ncbi:hypothetical protein B0H13DRAFT_2305126 [Mycena leptocephala]|nr:hypothetical protein B0H13DRAFT_2305126 [Mycena leptocephala]
MVSKRRYQRGLDHLDGLIVARVFELKKLGWGARAYCQGVASLMGQDPAY